MSHYTDKDHLTMLLKPIVPCLIMIQISSFLEKAEAILFEKKSYSMIEEFDNVVHQIQPC